MNLKSLLKMIKKLGACIIVLIIQSCSSKKNILYVQDANASMVSQISYPNLYIQPNDILKVTIGATVPEAAIPYNKTETIATVSNIDVLKLNGYLVSEDYTIKLPIMGQVSVKQKTPEQLEMVIKNMLLLEHHLENPIVEVRILNSKVTVLGEVNRPGTYGFSEKSITLFQALGYAGDLTINGKRKGVLIIREDQGERRITSVDLTSGELLKNSYYIVKPNDVIYVKPNMAKVKSAGYIGNFGTVLSVTSIVISAIVLLDR